VGSNQDWLDIKLPVMNVLVSGWQAGTSRNPWCCHAVSGQQALVLIWHMAPSRARQGDLDQVWP
jgi:5-keto 4-deoxyuronate isomerase